MSIEAFKRVLSETGVLTAGGKPSPGLVRATAPAAARLRGRLEDSRICLMADAVFTAQSMPAAVFKSSGDPPKDENVTKWREAVLNVGVAPLLWVVMPTDVRLCGCNASPSQKGSQGAAEPLDCFAFHAEDRLRPRDALCGHLAAATGAFWSSSLGGLERRHHVDREPSVESTLWTSGAILAGKATMTSMQSEDIGFMRRVLELARSASERGEHPFGALLVEEGRIVAEAGDRSIESCDPTAHPEILVIRERCSAVGTLSLANATLYANVEPCPMCATAAMYAGIRRIRTSLTRAELEATVSMARQRVFQSPINASQLYLSRGVPLDIDSGFMRDEALELISKYDFKPRHMLRSQRPGKRG
ncbi:nucleoside deaminase [Archangium sp. Cb G35]|uniref:nucleoside deaminase n=1 Tax=Archangium sp. Cb G35 TaxID=1920190 RepID=UPI0011610003|nr:nucleoside deaminase [Archangium sp. Cb G35]